MHAIGEAPASIRVDRCGSWLLVGEGASSVHVNGRPVRRKALLRAGDCVHVEGVAILLAGSKAPPAPVDVGAVAGGDGRIVLRGLGGRHHGRSHTLDKPRLIGSAADADIRIAGAGIAERHARIGLEKSGVVLRGIAAGEGSTVNGLPVHGALLYPGDQLSFAGGQRFVVEAPTAGLAPGRCPVADDAPEMVSTRPREAAGHRLPWLLLAALLIAAALSALLLL